MACFGLVHMTPQASIRQLKDLLNESVCLRVWQERATVSLRSCAALLCVDDTEKVCLVWWDKRSHNSPCDSGPNYIEQMFLPHGPYQWISSFSHAVHLSANLISYTVWALVQICSHFFPPLLFFVCDWSQWFTGCREGDGLCAHCVSTLLIAPWHRRSPTTLTCCL